MIKKAIAILLLVLAISWSYTALMPDSIYEEVSDHEFSTALALNHVKEISKNQHAVGSSGHSEVRDYIVSELEKLGLKPEIQEGYSISKWGNISKPKNILARIKGTEPGKSLLLLSHYDSSPHSSYGASDAGSGVATILEALRVFNSVGGAHKNDIIVLITDAEELGLNGADIFVNNHEWAKDVGLVLNFEARGSGGPSYMLIETNGGNMNMVKAFKKAGCDFPVANSLAYSIYKMLPNDTDLTRFREDGDIEGFNFAFIDDHFDYHTALDNYERLDRESLEHQASYLMPSLYYFANANLSNLKSTEDHVYFNVPGLKLVSYSFDLIWVYFGLAVLILMLLILYGIKKQRINTSDLLKGFFPFIISLLLSVIFTSGIWWLLKSFIYTKYNEMLHGFTYNGHSYIWMTVFLSLGLSFWIYGKLYKPGNTANVFVAPIVFWLIINFIFAWKLQGASFFIIPVLFALLSLLILIKQRKPNLILMALLCFPVLLIMSPFIKMFPVGLGLDILTVSALLVVMIYGLLIPVLGFLKHKLRWGIISLIIAFFFFIQAHFNSGFNAENPYPNSLVYIYDGDTRKAFWATYDKKPGSWVQQKLGEDPNIADPDGAGSFASKYGNPITFTREAPLHTFVFPEIEVFKDSIIDDYRHVSVYIEPQRDARRIEVMANSQYLFGDFTINGIKAPKREDQKYYFMNRWSDRLFTYYVSDNEPLEFKFTVPKNQPTTLVIYEASNDLLSDPEFGVAPRTEEMIPKPFILNDAIIYKKSIIIN